MLSLVVAAATSDEEITIKVGHGLPETMPIHQSWVKFQEDLAAKTDGRIKVEIYPNQMLGGDRELIEATQMGNIQATSPSSTPYANFVPEYYLWDVPFLFENRLQKLSMKSHLLSVSELLVYVKMDSETYQETVMV